MVLSIDDVLKLLRRLLQTNRAGHVEVSDKPDGKITRLELMFNVMEGAFDNLKGDHDAQEDDAPDGDDDAVE